MQALEQCVGAVGELRARVGSLEAARDGAEARADAAERRAARAKDDAEATARAELTGLAQRLIVAEARANAAERSAQEALAAARLAAREGGGAAPAGFDPKAEARLRVLEDEVRHQRRKWDDGDEKLLSLIHI